MQHCTSIPNPLHDAMVPRAVLQRIQPSSVPRKSCQDSKVGFWLMDVDGFLLPNLKMLTKNLGRKTRDRCQLCEVLAKACSTEVYIILAPKKHCIISFLDITKLGKHGAKMFDHPNVRNTGGSPTFITWHRLYLLVVELLRLRTSTRNYTIYVVKLFFFPLDPGNSSNNSKVDGTVPTSWFVSRTLY